MNVYLVPTKIVKYTIYGEKIIIGGLEKKYETTMLYFILVFFKTIYAIIMNYFFWFGV